MRRPGSEHGIQRRGTRRPRETGGVGDGSGAILRTHSTEEGGEAQGSGDGRPRDPLEGRGEQADVSVDSNMTVPRDR
jgi:hypothetical protein